VPRPRRN